MSGLSTRYVKSGPLNPRRRVDGYDRARDIWGQPTAETRALALQARRAGLRAVGYVSGRLVAEDPSTRQTVEIASADHLAALIARKPGA